MSLGEILAISVASVSAIFAGISAWVAWMAIERPRREARSKALMDQAILSLERAYDILTDGGQHVRPPPANRVNWLTAARHIVAYRNFRNQITDEAHKSICEDHTEWWRFRFYDAMGSQDIPNATYYRNRNARPAVELDPGSVIILNGFASWPVGREDVLTDAVVDDVLRTTELSIGNIGMRRFLRETRYAASLEARLEE